MSQHDRPSIADLLHEFGSEYLPSEAGKKLMDIYPRMRASGRENWDAVCRARDKGEDVTDLVLERLLPHMNTPYNRQKGAWIHIAPTITRDLKKWFEGAGWADAKDWPEIARAILGFFESVADHPDQYEEACREFGRSRYSKGFQSAFLSPMLNTLHPDRFFVVNTMSFRTIRYARGSRYSRKITAYPAANRALRDLHDELESDLRELAVDDTATSDVLDRFCHWLGGIKRVALPKTRGSAKNTEPRLVLDPGDPASVEAVLKSLCPDEEERTRVLSFLGDTVEIANGHGARLWNIRIHPRHVRFRIGKPLALEIRNGFVRIGVIPEPAGGDAAAVLASDDVEAEEVEGVQGAARYTLPTEIFVENLETLRPPFSAFLDRVAASTKRAFGKHSYSSGLMGYLDQALGRALPRPAHAGKATPSQMEPAIAFTGAPTVFKKVDYNVGGLLNYIENGDIALPDIQRPFVWNATKVRDLFDSMYRGFPVGYLLFWENSELQGAKAIGLDSKTHEIARLLIVDGQQRLTSLYAVMRGREVLDSQFRAARLKIAFRPRDGRFEVADAAVAQDPEFIPDISTLWTNGKLFYGLVNDFLKGLEARRELTDADKDAIGHNLGRLLELEKYPFTAVEITSSVDEEAVADIFVRINSEGVKLQQADFILTLLSVFWDEGRAALERFSRDSQEPSAGVKSPSPFNHLIQPDPSQLLRVSVAVGFHRARLRSVYQLLRGKNVETGQFSAERRDAQFQRLRQAQREVLDLTHWHQFLQVISAAGFRSGSSVASQNALLYAYALYLIGKTEHNVDERELQPLIARWFFMAILTGRYTSSPETTMESDLGRVRDRSYAPSFSEPLEKVIKTTLTKDFWEITVPSELETSSSRSPAWLTYVAAQNRLGTNVLFSSKRMWELMDPSLHAKKKALETHHLFPRAWLEKNGYPERRQFNQVANFAHLEWPDNIKVGAAPPVNYVPPLRKEFSAVAWERMCRAHALPDGWETLEYTEFLAQRRQLMAGVIRQGFEELGKAPEDTELHEDPTTGTQAEKAAWEEIYALETALRKLVRRKYQEKWKGSADQRIEAALGEKGWQVLQRNREKYSRQYKGPKPHAEHEALDFCYLGQLSQLMTSNQAWDLFRAPFRDKRELEDKIAAIVPVRNDSAHFRSVPEKELTRCSLAVDDLMRVIDEI